jgi:putative hydrolase of the HAD superfamily
LNRDLIESYINPLLPIPPEIHPGGKLNRPVKCILFDIYGTLFISDSGDIGVAKTKIKKQCKIQKLIEKCNLSIRPENLFQALYACIEEKHAKLRKKGIDFPEIEIDNIWMEVLKVANRPSIQQFSVEFEFIVNPVYPMPHLQEMLAAIKQRHIIMGIISNAQFFTPYLFDWFLGCDLKKLGFHPDLQFLSYELKHAKPSGLLFDMAIEKLRQIGIHAPSVLYVGNDMLNDIYPAASAGFQTALFAGDQRSLRLRKNDPRCSHLTPDLVITDLMQLLGHIK